MTVVFGPRGSRQFDWAGDPASTAALLALFAAHGVATCSCGKALGPDDLILLADRSGGGTDCSSITVECQKCGREAAHIASWYPALDDIDEVLYVLERDWSVS